ncbi:uncharacterized protein LOC106877083 [Octopus bimaculoides]|uniref:uncharacterized protein LOC106877083 n=1 Tax=Octopus bimaculoides TaxID=37653 RepID=UPI00071E57E7|nr:uncharacterized protein LOC106877083 [Octopus bimaculoides]|eukprot:XP_014781355.1 PREDICTED: uncharacterized protein LOC106877083 [Octopus bimaculoides]
MRPTEVKCLIPNKTAMSIVWITLLVFTNIIYSCNGLRCWKCISENCHQLDPNAEAMTVVCKKGQSCLKVIYQVGRIFPRYKSIVRSCSAGICTSHTTEEFHNCSSNPRKYNVTGCFLRTCCDDKDFCNDSSIVNGYLGIYIGIVLSLSFSLFWSY